MAGFPGASSAHQLGQENKIAALASTVVLVSSPRVASSLPVRTTSSQTGEALPLWESIAEWNFSAPDLEARHWKKRIPSAPAPPPGS